MIDIQKMPWVLKTLPFNFKRRFLFPAPGVFCVFPPAQAFGSACAWSSVAYCIFQVFLCDSKIPSLTEGMKYFELFSDILSHSLLEYCLRMCVYMFTVRLPWCF